MIKDCWNMCVFIFKYKTKDQKQMSVLFAFYQKVNREIGYKDINIATALTMNMELFTEKMI